ncbi:hypothetical protein [Methyloferula stellata]|uniref:hypothetical protein n=1 Tax=Methyloferula stellata TaxID=876270 RepID=UPI00036A9C0B|nr:hypothetical protein [Methyloferula stellata]
MLVLIKEEIRLLQDLEKGERTISGNRNRQGLSRLIEAGYVTEQSLNLSDTIYTITALGRTAVQAAKEH